MKKDQKVLLRRKAECGMSLLEVLVSMLIIGLALGMSVGMIQSSVRYERSARDRAYALESVNSLISMINSNKLGADSYVTGSTEISSINKPTNPCTPSTCTDNQYAEKMARVDLYNWLEDLRLGLPGAKAKIVNNGVQYEVTISWTRIQESEVAAKRYNSETSFSTSFRIF